MWESVGFCEHLWDFSGFPVGLPGIQYEFLWDLMWVSMGFHVGFCGIPVGFCGIMWEFPQKSCGNGIGMGIGIPFPRQPWLQSFDHQDVRPFSNLELSHLPLRPFSSSARFH